MNTSRFKFPQIPRRARCIVALAAFFAAPVLAATPPSVPGSSGAGPLKIDAIRLSFGALENGPTTVFVKSGEAMPSFKAVIRYTGSGSLRGRWELASPADAAPDDSVVVPESQMSAVERSNAQRFEALETFDALLPPLVGSHALTGPILRAESVKFVGAYRILLRLEDANSAGLVVSQKRLPVTSLRLHLLGGPSPDSVHAIDK